MYQSKNEQKQLIHSLFMRWFMFSQTDHQESMVEHNISLHH